MTNPQPDLATRIHNWFRLIPKGFAPRRVQDMLTNLQCSPDETVLDPFAGEGTTLIECQLKNIRAYGFEINPFIYFVAKTITDWRLEANRATHLLENIQTQFNALKDRISFENLEDFGFQIPPIDRPLAWWRKDVITDLLILKHAIESLEAKEYTDFFLLALADVLVPELTNVRFEFHQMFLTDRESDKIDVMETFVRKATSMLADLRELNELGIAKQSTLLNIDSTRTTDLELDRQINCIITGPPYPERYSYVWNTLPHLYLFGYLTHPQEASTLDESTIGGTWGRATFSLAKEEIKPAYPVIESVVGPLAEQLRREDNLTANYIMKYFNLLAKQIMELERLPHRNLRAAYHVGHSRLKGVLIETDVLLAEIFEGLNVGYKVRATEHLGYLFGGTDLRESIVYAWKQ